MHNSRVPLLPMPDFVHDQSAVLNVDTTAGNCSSLLSGHSAPLASSSGETNISVSILAIIFGGAGRFTDTGLKVTGEPNPIRPRSDTKFNSTLLIKLMAILGGASILTLEPDLLFLLIHVLSLSKEFWGGLRKDMWLRHSFVIALWYWYCWRCFSKQWRKYCTGYYIPLWGGYIHSLFCFRL